MDRANDSAEFSWKTVSSHKDSRDELIYLDDVAADGSIRRTYFKSADQLGRVLHASEPSRDMLTSKTSNDLDATKRRWTSQDSIDEYKVPEEAGEYHEPAVYLSDSHPEIKEALQAQEDEEEPSDTNVLRIDFEELFQSTASAKQAKGHSYASASMISKGIQTEDHSLHVTCSKCMRCGERTDVKVRLDFGDTPVKPTSGKSISQKSANLLASGTVIRPRLKQSATKVEPQSEPKVNKWEVSKRLLFRQKPTASSQQPKVETTIFTASKPVPSASKVNQKTYLKHFEARKNVADNSDMKYFASSWRKMSQHSIAAAKDYQSRSLNKSSSVISIESSHQKSVGGRSLGPKRAENPTLDIPVEVSLDSLMVDSSLVVPDKAKGKSFDKTPQWPLEVDIDLGELSLVTDQTYVRRRETLGHALHKKGVRGAVLKRNWKTAAIN